MHPQDETKSKPKTDVPIGEACSASTEESCSPGVRTKNQRRPTPLEILEGSVLRYEDPFSSLFDD